MKNFKTSYLLRLFRPYWLRVLEAGVCMVFTTILALPMPLLSIYIIDHVIANGQMLALHLVCVTLALATVLGLGLGFLQRYLLLVFARRVFFDMEMRLFRLVQTFPIAFFRKHGSGYIATRISNDVRQLGSLMAGTYIEGLSSLVLLFIALGVMLTIHLKLALIALVILPGLTWANLYFGRRVQTQSDRLQERKGLTNAIRLESIDAVHMVRAFERGKREAICLARNLHEEVAIQLHRDTTMMKAEVLQMALYSVGGLFLLWYGTYEIIEKRLTLGQFVAFNTLLSYVYGPMSQLSGLYVSFRQGLGVLKRIFELLDMPPEAGRDRRTIHISRGEVVFERTQFSYDSHHPVLNGVSFKLEPDQITAIVGPTGAGKTTLANLLLRFYNPNSGHILIDGEDIQKIDVGALRGNIGLVEQDIRLFSGTIHENIAYGKLGATDEEVGIAAEAMNCMEFICRFPEGLNTRIGTGGVQLSGGQKQRVALARAIVRKPKIIILDEATSSLDARSENLVQDALKKASKGRTTLLIAHSLSTMSIAERILVLSGGRIVEEGTFQELLDQDGYFRKYYQQDRETLAV